LIKNQTYALLSHAKAALVTSGTATLETALFDVPQVVCYETPVPKIIRFAFNHIIKVKYISLVNLIADSEIVQELLADRFSVDDIIMELRKILPGRPEREVMLKEYEEIHRRLGNSVAPENAARIMTELLMGSNNSNIPQ
jgi:lipid-A-disaccharide synthase